MLKITFQYILFKLDENTINDLILREIDINKKTKVLIELPEDRIKAILLELGLKTEFLNTL